MIFDLGFNHVGCVMFYLKGYSFHNQSTLCIFYDSTYLTGNTKYDDNL